VFRSADENCTKDSDARTGNGHELEEYTIVVDGVSQAAPQSNCFELTNL